MWLISHDLSHGVPLMYSSHACLANEGPHVVERGKDLMDESTMRSIKPHLHTRCDGWIHHEVYQASSAHQMPLLAESSCKICLGGSSQTDWRKPKNTTRNVNSLCDYTTGN
jgi:hypothetical protein